MGGEQTKTRSKKGVVYSKENHEVVDCLFCRIVRGESPPNQLWYRDDQCAVFIPRGPAARLHLLVVPLQHIQNVSTLTEEHRSLLEHMKKVNRMGFLNL
jgi:diadenosine tetraphosphate (Ap4A) HIT family hydrolase